MEKRNHCVVLCRLCRLNLVWLCNILLVLLKDLLASDTESQLYNFFSFRLLLFGRPHLAPSGSSSSVFSLIFITLYIYNLLNSLSHLFLHRLGILSYTLAISTMELFVTSVYGRQP